MKILVYEWGAYLQYDLYALLHEKGIAFSTFLWKFENKNGDDAFESWFLKEIDLEQFDALLSVNYWPLLSKMCQAKGVKYIAWCYDAPLNVEKIEDTLANEVNYVFLFDRAQYIGYKDQGIDTVYHLPLGVNVTRYSKLSVSSAERQKYEAEVSFVGSLYESKIYAITAPLSEEIQAYINTLINTQLRLYGHYLFDEMISDEILQEINRQYKMACSETMFQISKPALTFAMASEVTRKERMILLNLCAKRFDTKFYSYQNNELLGDVKMCPPIDYVTEMPKVFACTKINLNPSLKIIQSGIPLRVFDIMASGGFLLSNYQEEILELYEKEKDLVIYDSLEDAIEKVGFYLEQEGLRERIAKNGREKTLREYTLQKRFEKILKIVF